LCKEDAPAKFTDPEHSKDFLILNHGQTKHERFSVLFLNAKNGLIEHDIMFQGSISNAHIYPRTVAQRALEVNAAAVIFCHNHPSGDLEPTRADIDITKRLTKSLVLFDIRVLDHIIIGDGQALSMASRQLM
jgi:DNA repair protein RadC